MGRIQQEHRIRHILLFLLIMDSETGGGVEGAAARAQLRIVANLIVPSANNYHGPTLQLDCEPLLDYRLFHCISATTHNHDHRHQQQHHEYRTGPRERPVFSRFSLGRVLSVLTGTGSLGRLLQINT